jgi:hypothetical protein
MAKFNNSLAIQNILGATNPHQFKQNTSKSRNTGPTGAGTQNNNGPQFKTTAAVGLSLGSTKGIGKNVMIG